MSIDSRRAGTAFGSVPSHGKLTQGQLAGLWVQAGGPAPVAGVAAAIAMAESGGNIRAYNPSGATGLWQILGAVVSGNLYDPLVNARNAVKKWQDAGQSWTPWEAYTNGSYKQYLTSGSNGGGSGILGGLGNIVGGGIGGAAGTVAGGVIEAAGGLNPLGGVEGAVEAAESAEEFLSKILRTLTDFRALGNLAASAFAWFLKLIARAIWDYVIAPIVHWSERAVSFYWVNFFGSGTEQGSGFGYQLRNNAGAITIFFWSMGYAILWSDGASLAPLPAHESLFGQGVRSVEGAIARRNLIKPGKVKEKTPPKPEPKESKVKIERKQTFSVARKRPVTVHSEGRQRVSSQGFRPHPIPRPTRQKTDANQKIILPPGVTKEREQKAKPAAKPGRSRVGT